MESKNGILGITENYYGNKGKAKELCNKQGCNQIFILTRAKAQ